MVTSMNELKERLFSAFGGFADKRIKDLDKSNLFIVDDRTTADNAADGRLFSWFCEIFAEVVDKDTIKINMRGNVPDGPLVAKWFTENSAKDTNFGREVTLRRGEQQRLTGLAAAIRAIIQPGATYEVSSYKYVCPRVAASLEKVRCVLDETWAG